MTILDLSNAISRKRCKIIAKLVLVTNRKSHMSFRLIPTSVTLDDFEQRNSTAFGSFRGELRKSSWVYTNTFCSGDVRPKNFDDIIYGDIGSAWKMSFVKNVHVRYLISWWVSRHNLISWVDRLQAWRYGIRMSARKISAVPGGLLHTSLWSCRSTASTVSQSLSACRPSLPTEHLRPTGLFCRRPVCLELTTGRFPGSGH